MLNARRAIGWILGGVSLITLGFLLAMGQPFTAKAQEPKHFLYKIVQVLPNTQAMQAVLNEYGTSGWELVAVSMGDMTEPRLIFKK
jgi:hypothetical protein